MATKTPKRTPRAFHVQPDTTVEYVADIDGVPPYATGPWIIRQRVTGKPMREWPIIDRAPGAHKSEVDARVAVLNRGTPTVGEERSWGRLKREGERHAPKRKYPNLSGLSVTQWIERLYADPRISAQLRDYAARHLSLTREVLESLLWSVDELDRELSDEMLNAIAIDLWEKFGIHRAEEGRRKNT
jgi:hypothetical protein